LHSPGESASRSAFAFITALRHVLPGWRADQFKPGSITQSERLAKYNRLLAIEAETSWPLVRWP